MTGDSRPPFFSPVRSILPVFEGLNPKVHAGQSPGFQRDFILPNRILKIWGLQFGAFRVRERKWESDLFTLNLALRRLGGGGVLTRKAMRGSHLTKELSDEIAGVLQAMDEKGEGSPPKQKKKEKQKHIFVQDRPKYTIEKTLPFCGAMAHGRL